MNQEPWRLGAVELAARIRDGQISAREAAESTLARIAEVNPRINAIAEVMQSEALAAADAADRAAAQGAELGPLHGVPITIKVNVDTAGHATSDGIVANRDNIAQSDSPLVSNFRRAGAVIVGRTNTPAFSLRFFTDNDLYGRTLNPFDPAVTPGGSSGGAAAAVATGMGSIAHGNDYGGSIRYPAWACGVVGLRTTPGRVPVYKGTLPTRIISTQIMSVQGPLTRSVADARLAMQAMSAGSALDPNWVPAPLEFPEPKGPTKVALFARHPSVETDSSVAAAVEQAAHWLAAAGYEVEEVVPPRFDEAAVLWRRLVVEDSRRAVIAAVEQKGDHGTRQAMRGYAHGLAPWSADECLDALARRLDICREWALFFERYPLMLMPNCWQRQFPIDADKGSPEEVERVLVAQGPMLVIATLGLPGLSVPTGMDRGLPTGVQICSARFREDLALRAGEVIERAAGFSALEQLLR